MIKLKCILLLFVVASQTHSHEFLTQILVTSDTIEVSPDYHYSVKATFHLNPQQLQHLLKKDIVKQEIKRAAASQHEDVNTEHITCDDWDSVFKTCGVFDDFNDARSIAIDLCAGVALSSDEVHVDGLIPQFMGPATFTDGGTAADDHHSIYNFSHGLSFNCVEIVSTLATE